MFFTYIKDSKKTNNKPTKDRLYVACRVKYLLSFTQKVCQPALVYSVIQIKIKTVYDLMLTLSCFSSLKLIPQSRGSLTFEFLGNLTY